MAQGDALGKDQTPLSSGMIPERWPGSFLRGSSWVDGAGYAGKAGKKAGKIALQLKSDAAIALPLEVARFARRSACGLCRISPRRRRNRSSRRQPKQPPDSSMGSMEQRWDLLCVQTSIVTLDRVAL